MAATTWVGTTAAVTTTMSSSIRGLSGLERGFFIRVCCVSLWVRRVVCGCPRGASLSGSSVRAFLRSREAAGGARGGYAPRSEWTPILLFSDSPRVFFGLLPLPWGWWVVLGGSSLFLKFFQKIRFHFNF